MTAEVSNRFSTRNVENTDISIKKTSSNVGIRDRKAAAGSGRTGRGKEVGMGRPSHTEVAGSAMKLYELCTPTRESPVMVRPHLIC
jgi:hypothetical protein